MHAEDIAIKEKIRDTFVTLNFKTSGSKDKISLPLQKRLLNVSLYGNKWQIQVTSDGMNLDDKIKLEQWRSVSMKVIILLKLYGNTY